MSKLKLPIIIALVLAAAGAGLFFSGIVGGDKGPAKKHVVEPIPLTPPDGQFIINLSDADQSAILALNIALDQRALAEQLDHHRQKRRGQQDLDDRLVKLLEEFLPERLAGQRGEPVGAVLPAALRDLGVGQAALPALGELLEDVA